jgi:dUTP pyrophosphatase
MTEVRVTKVREGARVPSYMSTGAAGCDVSACLEAPMAIAPGKRAAVPTGLAVEIPLGYEIQVRPRSGLSFKRGLTVVNAPGTIDSDYRGEVMVLVINLGEETVEVQPGDRIAQLVLQQVEQITWREVNELAETARGAGGFGSTGVSHGPASERDTTSA